ncbi:MAG: MerR family transcriptional regulator [Acidobacteria bacterium]|nr:MerR family transcriptional regulator [Acidobacteriota bacterium]
MADLYFISMAARLLDMHPQTLRKYERLGLVRPSRTVGSMRVYSVDELERLRLIKRLVDDAGINMVKGEASRIDSRRRLAQEIDRIGEIAGL